MKTKERDEAIRLRSESGLSIGEIARRIGVSKGTTSIWLRNIVLTDEQKQTLIDRGNGSYGGQAKGSAANKANAERKRIDWQKQGREIAKKRNWLHVAGCMLYWGEGWKKNNRSSVYFANAELPMMVLFLRFLRECFGVERDDVAVSINCYTDIHSIEEIEGYWLEGLGLSRSCLRKTIANRRPFSSKRKANGILPYGTCRIVVHDVSLMQKILGGIQEYGGFENKW